MGNQLVNKFYTQFLFKMDALLQYVVFQIDITATFFNDLSPDGRKFWVSEGVHSPPWPPTETNNQGNQRLFCNKFVCGIRKEKKNNKGGSATRKWKLTFQDIHGYI